MSKGKIFVMVLMILALLAMPLLACGDDDATEYDLTISVNPAGSGTTTPSAGTSTHDDGDEVTITATAAEGYEFDSWSGDLSGSGNPASITMDADKTVTANFTEIAPAIQTYDVVYDYNDGTTIYTDTSTWTITAAGEETLETDYYSGTALKLDVNYDPEETGTYPLRTKMKLDVELISGSIWFDASNRMLKQVAQTAVGGTPTTVTVVNEWLDDLGMPDEYIVHTDLEGAGPESVDDEFHQVIPATGTETVTVDAGTFTCTVLKDYMIGEGRKYKSTPLGTGDGSTTAFVSGGGAALGINPGEEVVYVDGVRQYRGTDYTIDYGTATVTFAVAPASGAVLTMDFNFTLYTTGDDPTTGRLWRVDYIDTADPSAGLVRNLDYMYGYPNSEQVQELVS